MQDSKERAVFTLSKFLKDELEEVVPASKRSQFVEKAIADALMREAKRKSLVSLRNLPAYDTGGRDSVEVLSQIRSERGEYIASRHQVTK